jgi:hypothetical protein
VSKRRGTPTPPAADARRLDRLVVTIERGDGAKWTQYRERRDGTWYEIDGPAHVAGDITEAAQHIYDELTASMELATWANGR